jgi:hypothetical protein
VECIEQSQHALALARTDAWLHTEVTEKGSHLWVAGIFVNKCLREHSCGHFNCPQLSWLLSLSCFGSVRPERNVLHTQFPEFVF